MALVYNYGAQTLSDLYATVPINGTVCTLECNTTPGDRPVTWWVYNNASTATDDGGVSVVQPTSVSGAGRWLIQTINQQQADYTQASSSALTYIQHKPTLATVATSGSYTDLSNKPTITSGTVTSIGLTSTDFSVSGSPVTTSGNITANLNTSGVTAGTYTNVTVNSKGIVTAGTAVSISTQTRSFNTAFQPSTTRVSFVNYSVQIAATLTLTGGQTGTILLQTSPDNVTYTTMAEFVNGNTGTLTVGLTLTQTQANVLSCFVPANYYVKLVTSGTATITYLAGQETLL